MILTNIYTVDNYKTVYEIGKFDFHIGLSYFVLVLLLVAFTFTVVHNIKYNITLNQETNHRQVVTERVFAIFGLCVVSCVFLVALTTTIIDYYNIQKIYNDRNLLIVEGEVEDFIPMELEGHSSESFTVNGVNFTYSRSVPTYGYHLAKVDGGYIKGNGQKIKIHYVNYNNNNLILKLEIEE